jgi:hypothetical protein
MYDITPSVFIHLYREVCVRDDLQELVDEVSRVLAAPATFEDSDFTLLAFCAHSAGPTDTPDGGMDRSAPGRS